MALSDNSNITKADDTDQKQNNIQLSVTAEKLNDITKAAKSTTQSLNNVFNAVSGANNFARTFDDLSSDELIELKFEMCDFYHFVMNMMLALDMTAEEMFMYYYIKNAENHQRALNGY